MRSSHHKHQPRVDDDWDIDMKECLNVFQMDVGEEFEDGDEEQVGESSTRAGKSQTYVKMKENLVHIKTMYIDKNNPQGEGDLEEVTRVIETRPIGIVRRKHVIIANINAIVKDGLQKEKEIKGLKNELAAQKKLMKEIEMARMTSKDIRRQILLNEGLSIVKGELSQEL